MAEITLKQFDMDMIQDDSVVVFIGKRNTGKSFLIRDLLYKKKSFPIGTVISATDCVNGFYADMIPSIFIHHKYNDDLVGNVLKRQADVMRENKLRVSRKLDVIDPRAFFIMDDMMATSNAWTRSENISGVFCNGRHYKLMFLLSLQYSKGIPPAFRNNTDFVFILKEHTISSREKLWSEWAGMFERKVFYDILDQCTNNYGCLVIKNNSHSNKIEDRVFWYKAEKRNEFKICSKMFWEMDAQITQQEENERDKQEERLDETNGAFKLTRANNVAAPTGKLTVKKKS